MNLLIQAVVILLLVGIPASISTWQIGRSRHLSAGVFALLIAAPVVDSILAYWLFNWFGITGVTLRVGTLHRYLRMSFRTIHSVVAYAAPAAR